MLKTYLLYPLRGIFNAVFFILITVIIALLVFISAVFIFIVPNKKFRRHGMQFMQYFPVLWIDGISALLNLSFKNKIVVQGPTNLQKNKSYLLISNHVSWIDIFILSYAFHRKTPSLRFFMKKQLLWTLPLAGAAAWLLGYPFMQRHTSSQIRKNPHLKNKDIETTRQACKRFETYPVTLMNYIEGTRFTEQKRINKNSPYRHLLPPKAGGIAIVLQQMHHHLAGVINATIAYHPQPINFWRFCCGHFSTINCHYTVLPLQAEMLGDYVNNREFRVIFQTWLNKLWQQKDDELDQLKSTYDR